MDIYDFITIDEPSGDWVLTTRPLLRYARRLTIRELQRHGLPLDLKVNDVVFLSPTRSQVEKLSQDIQDPFLSQKPPWNVRYVVAEDHGNFRYTIHPIDEEAGEAVGKPVSVFCLRPPDDTLQKKLENLETNIASIPSQVLFESLSFSHYLSSKWKSLQPRRRRPLSQSLFCENLRFARNILSFLMEQQNSILSYETALGIQILFNALECAVANLFDEHAVAEPEGGILDAPLQAAMQKRGWCATQMTPSLRTDSLLLASLLNSHDDRDHSRCQRTFCSYRLRRLGDQKPHHDNSHCPGTCAMQVFDEGKLVSLLRAGKIPGIRQHTHPGHGRKYEIVDTAGRRYVAISHVWSHGLGNSSQNSLWSCQLEQLFAKLSALGESNALLWIDTILVPHDPVKKPLALPKMKNVYSNACKVLVIDSRLTKVGDRRFEQGLHLLLSEWMTRLWTLQEGRLTSSLYIQFRNKAVPWTEFQDIAPPIDDPTGIFHECYACISIPLRATFAIRERLSDRLLDVATSLTSRSATVLEDEPIVLDTLLNLNLVSESHIPTMEDIYLALREVPKDFLFTQKSRLDRKGLRWAPSTLMEQSIFPSYNGSEPAIRTEDGLCLATDCLFLDHQTFSYHSFACSPFDDYLISCIDGQGFTFSVSGDSNNVPPIVQLDNLAILFQKQVDTFITDHEGVLVHSLVDTEGRWHGQLVQGVRIAVVRMNGDSVPQNSAFRKARQRRLHHLSGVFLKQGAFCVD